MTQALFVKKTGRTIGKIIDEDSNQQEVKSVPQSPVELESKKTIVKEYSNAELIKKPSHVVLMTNMVEAKDVDDDLENEIKSDCQKHGTISSMKIHPFSGSNDGNSQVRIFIEYDSIPSAVKSVIDLNRRFFDGKMITCAF